MPARPQHGLEISESTPRYEFRVWGRDLALLFARLQEASDLEEIEDSAESYIVCSRAIRFNTKVRGGSLDVKELLKTRGQLELWRPYLKAGFPLTRQTIQDRVCPVLSLDPQQIVLPAYELDLFITTIIDPSPDLTLVPVNKRRYRFTIETCLAEFTDVSVCGEHIDTVAVESQDVAATLRAIARLGLCGQQNQSYQDALRAILRIGNSDASMRTT